MDLNSFTTGQRKAITHLDGPLLVCAGAGTGKTFTLTQRIAYALVGDPENGVEPTLESIEQALVITFTNKAAAELKSRFRTMLRSVGRFDDALKVDSAWVSTIHGMCSRILREHALELGIDPEFKLIMGADQEDALLQAINLAIHDADGYERFQPLFDEYDALGVKKMLKTLIDATSCQTKGLDSLCVGPEPASSARMLYDLLDAAVALSIKGTKKTAESAESAARKISEFIDGGHGEEEIPNLIESLGVGRLRGEAAAEMKEISAFLHDQAHLNKGRRLLDLLIELARKVDGHYRDILRAQGTIDTSSLIRTTLQAFDEHPEIAKQYTDRFKLIMVDEFQDTSQLQIDMIERIAGTEHTHLCTVGDSQQSIYRFQGADVEVYLKHKKDMERSGALMIELQDNFRSHKDILSFVRCICGRTGFFIEDFLDLKASRKGGFYNGSSPRIELALTTYERGASGQAAETQAEHIAMRFSQLINEGHKPSEMAILMGSTKHMALYANALRRRGIPSMAAGGSNFYRSEHVKHCLSLIRTLANPYDSISMMDVLCSDILPVSSDDLLLISTSIDPETNIPSRQALANSFLYSENAPEGSSPLLSHAMQVLRKAWSELGSTNPSKVFMGTLIDSGWIDRLQAKGQEGQAVLADILKLARIIEKREKEGCSDMAGISASLDASAESENEAMGVLSVEGLQAVRLMTIHGSKGLQFPIVAVTDCFTSRKDSGALATCADSDTLHASLLPREINDTKLKAKPDIPEDLLSPDTAGDLVNYRAKIKQKNTRCSEAEQRRLFYVAATRAEESLLIAVTKQEAKTPSYKEIEADLLQSLYPGEDDFPEESGKFEYSGSEPGVYTRYRISKDKLDSVDEDDAFHGEGQAVPHYSVPVEKNQIEEHRFGSIDEPANESENTIVDELHFSKVNDTGNTCNPPIQSIREDQIIIPKITSIQTAELVPVSLRKDFFSYSSLPKSEDTYHTQKDQRNKKRYEAGDCSSSEADEPLDETKAHRISEDADKATDFGTALHKTCEWLALQNAPKENDIFKTASRFAENYRINDKARLDNALKNWLDSKECKEAYSHEFTQPEVPFYVKIGEKYLEGEIDLLCHDNGTEALIIDYKSGGNASETQEEIQKKHLLQSQCYAYAALRSHFEKVLLKFVRLEQVYNGAIQTAEYSYSKDDLKMLERTILHTLEQ